MSQEISWGSGEKSKWKDKGGLTWLPGQECYAEKAQSEWEHPPPVNMLQLGVFSHLGLQNNRSHSKAASQALWVRGQAIAEQQACHLSSYFFKWNIRTQLPPLWPSLQWLLVAVIDFHPNLMVASYEPSGHCLLRIRPPLAWDVLQGLYKCVLRSTAQLSGETHEAQMSTANTPGLGLHQSFLLTHSSPLSTDTNKIKISVNSDSAEGAHVLSQAQPWLHSSCKSNNPAH